MKIPEWGSILGLLVASTHTLAQDVVIKTVSIDTGSCALAASTGGLASNGGAGGGPGISGLPSGIGGNGDTGNGSGASGLPSATDGGGAISPSSTSILGGSGTGSPLPSAVKLSVGSNSNSGSYNYTGFYPLPSNGSLLNGAVTARGARFGGYMTLESCAYACKGVPFFALEQGYICQCGTLAPVSTPVNDPPMPIACTGDATEICGAPGYGIVYRGSPQPNSVVTDIPTGQATVPTGLMTTINDVTTTNPLGSTTVQTTIAISSGVDGEPVTVVSDTTKTAVTSGMGQSVESITAAAGTSSAASTPSIPSPISPTVAGPSSSAAPGAPSTTADGQSSLIAPASPSSTAAAASSSNYLPASDTPGPSVGGSPTTAAGATSAAEPTLIAVPSCPATGPNSNNTRYVDLFDHTYDIRCGIDVVGSQRTTAHADTFLRCLQYCDLLDGCIGVTYVDTINRYNNNTNCNSYYTFEGYSSVTQPVDGTFYSGVNVHGPSNGAVDPSSGESTNEDLCAPPVTNEYGPDVYANCYQVGCDQAIGQSASGTPLAPTVLSSLLGCSLYCSFYNDCVSVTWTGPFVPGQDTVNCFPKSTYNTTVATAEVGTDFAFNGKCPGT